jgi:hypothetical protein
MERGPVETYLSQLRRRLPYPAPRLIGETREHLLEATSVALAAGLSQEEAERKAVDTFGPVDDVVAAVLKDGSAVMSPRVVRWFVPLAVLLCIPTAIFVSANLVEELAGSGGSSGVFGSAFDSWRTQIDALLVFGPMIALALIVLVSLRVHRERGVNGFALTIELRMSRPTFWAAVVVALVAAAVVAYGVLENFGTWRDFHNQNWSCTIGEDGRQVCYQGNSLGEP